MARISMGSSGEEKISAPSKEPKVKFELGDGVILISAKYGWNYSKKGDVGLVCEIREGNAYSVYLTDHGFAQIYANTDLQMNPDAKVVLDQKTQDAVNTVCYMLQNRTQILEQKRNRAYEVMSRLEARRRDVYAQVRQMTKTIDSDKRQPQAIKKSSSYSKIAAELMTTKYSFIETIGSHTLSAITKPISAFYNDYFPLIHFGQYKIDIVMNENIRITNTDTRKVQQGTYHHPHISHTTVCWGNESARINEKFVLGEYFELLSHIYYFLAAPYPAGWYLDMRFWLDDMDKRCRHCFKLQKKECRCSHKCNICKRVERECTCFVCPDTHIAIRGNYPTDYCKRSCTRYDKVKGCELLQPVETTPVPEPELRIASPAPGTAFTNWQANLRVEVGRQEAVLHGIHDDVGASQGHGFADVEEPEPPPILIDDDEEEDD